MPNSTPPVTAPLPHKLLVIQESTLQLMANSDRFLTELPFLRSLRQLPRRTGCGSCGGGINMRARLEAFSAAKRTIAGLASDKKATLKRLLNARAIRVIFRKPDGQTVALTF